MQEILQIGSFFHSIHLIHVKSITYKKKQQPTLSPYFLVLQMCSKLYVFCHIHQSSHNKTHGQSQFESIDNNERLVSFCVKMLQFQLYPSTYSYVRMLTTCFPTCSIKFHLNTCLMPQCPPEAQTQCSGRTPVGLTSHHLCYWRNKLL